MFTDPLGFAGMVSIGDLGTSVVNVALPVEFGGYAISALGTFEKSVSISEPTFCAVLRTVTTVKYLLHPFPSLSIDKRLVFAFVNLSPPAYLADVEWITQQRSEM